MNLTEVEAKVREATNNEPWGAPTSLMAQIAAVTHNYREREEVVGFILRRFTEKGANEWRQIYKLLQLLEYLIKNGSERVVDDVRSNLLLLQMLKLFHYIDSKGRDQGMNVRNRAKTLISLIGDDALVRSERKKARANAAKFGGVLLSLYSRGSHGSLAYYGDDDLSSRVYGDGGVYGERYDDPALQYTGGLLSRQEEYDENVSLSLSAPPRTSTATTRTQKVNAAPEPDLLGDLLGDSSTATAPTTASTANNNGLDDDDDDEFDDFQAAPSQPDKPMANLANLYQLQPHSQPSHVQQQPANFQNITHLLVSMAKPSGDAFSSLFSSAKSTSNTNGSRTSVSTSRNASVVGSKPVENKTQPQSVAAPQPPTGELDLLSL